ncbi:MAG: beta-ketoacyl-[acyl-carrier-protein] synthase family protein [Planctomycetales bacterium]|nr:beta-ketoacyl-[acyl-carrier-protein] synthase family protein [Planctomycetales bacterium]
MSQLDNSERVVITGMGLVSPIGNTLQDVWESLSEQRSGVERIQSLPAEGLPTSIAAEARGFAGDMDDFGELDKETKRAIKKGTKMMCREIAMGVAAAQHALLSASLTPEKRDPQRTGVVYGSDYIMTLPQEFADGVRKCLDENQEFQYDRWAEEGLPKVDPLWLLKYLPNMPASHIAIYNDLRGPNNSITLRESGSNLAIGEAYCTIARGSADAIVAGATGTRVHPFRTVHVALQEELATGEDAHAASRPFDLNRTGMVLGEGAGAVVLERLDHALARGAEILGEIVGHASSTVMLPTGEAQCGRALANVLRQSLQNAGLMAGQLGHIHAHGLSTRQGDVEEAQAIADVAGSGVPVAAGKSYFGNLGAGGGVVELICSVLAMKHNRMFPLLNYTTRDPACPIRAAEADEDPGDCFVNINVTPQGQAAAVVVKRYDG